MRGDGGRWAAAAIIAALAMSGPIAFHLLVPKGLLYAGNVFVIATFVLAVIVAVAPILRLLLARQPAIPLVSEWVQEACAKLAEALDRQDADDVQLRLATGEGRLRVRWRLLCDPTAPESDGTGFSESTGHGQAEASDNVHTVFVGKGNRRLVILGQPGAGKTMLAISLIRRLQKEWKAGDPVPMLLSAATWSADCTIREWIAEQISRTRPGLDVYRRTDAGEELWLPYEMALKGILPVIDALDELTPHRRAAFMAEINDWGPDRSIVITSRPEEYWAAVATRNISPVVVAELENLGAAEIKRYLGDGAAKPPARWKNVFDHLNDEPKGVLATTLAIPLMTWLARTIYRESDSEPGELVKLGQYGRATVEAHLVKAFVPAVYKSRRRSRSGKSGPRQLSLQFHRTPRQATRWLGFLAYHLDQSGTQDVAWWRLCLADPRSQPVLAAVRAALRASAWWLAAIWLLSRHSLWRRGISAVNRHPGDLLLVGPVGRTALPAIKAALAYIVRPGASVANGYGSLIFHAVLSAAGLLVRPGTMLIEGDFNPDLHANSPTDPGLQFLTHLGPLPFVCVLAAYGFVYGCLFDMRVFAPRAPRLRWPDLRQAILR